MKKLLSLVLSLIILSTLTLSANAVFFSGKYEIIFHTKQTYENTEYENIFSDHRNFLKTEVYGIDGIIHIDILAAFCSINAHQNPPVYILRAATTAETRVAAREIADELVSLGITDNATVMDMDEFSEFFFNFKPHSSIPENRITLFSGENFGDIDCTGKVTASDARTALRISVELEKQENYPYILGDMNYDGKITASDAREILRVSVGLSVYGTLD